MPAPPRPHRGNIRAGAPGWRIGVGHHTDVSLHLLGKADGVGSLTRWAPSIKGDPDSLWRGRVGALELSTTSYLLQIFRRWCPTRRSGIRFAESDRGVHP